MSTKKNEATATTPNEYAVRFIQANYESAVREVHAQARWLRQACDEAERGPDVAHTPGNISRTAACLDAAREKASTLRGTLEALGAPPKPVDDRHEQVRQTARAGKKIAAIKLHRELFGSSLFDAKNYVENIGA